MISELRVRELGVIADVDVVFGPGLTVISGETGAGKTLIVEALELLVGGRGDPSIVRFGAAETRIEGRFVDGDDEVVVARVIPASGRSRAFVDDKMVPISTLEERGRDLLDLHGQHAHQSLLLPATQRQALDAYAGVDLDAVRALRSSISALDSRLELLGGDERMKARELDLLGFELAEIESAAIASDDEDDQLRDEEEQLSLATSLRLAALAAHDALQGAGNPGALDLVGEAVAETTRYAPLAGHAERLRGLVAELGDAADELRRAAERFEENPERLAAVTERRQLFGRLVRKYGDCLADVVAAGELARSRIGELSASEETRAALETERAALVEQQRVAEQAVGDRRRGAADAFAAAVEGHLRELTLGRARLSIEIPPDGIGDDVRFLLSANAGEPALALNRVASGGELARAMLALRLVLSAGPPTLVFDEVDAGIGGEAALAVGRALAALGRDHQVLVVTHLAQVAAYADHQLVVEKDEEGGRTISRCFPVEGEARVAELSRMLSGHPDSAAARTHAAELLEQAGVATS